MYWMVMCDCIVGLHEWVCGTRNVWLSHVWRSNLNAE